MTQVVVGGTIGAAILLGLDRNLRVSIFAITHRMMRHPVFSR
jgi:hypothetical protein